MQDVDSCAQNKTDYAVELCSLWVAMAPVGWGGLNREAITVLGQAVASLFSQDMHKAQTPLCIWCDRIHRLAPSKSKRAKSNGNGVFLLRIGVEHDPPTTAPALKTRRCV